MISDVPLLVHCARLWGFISKNQMEWTGFAVPEAYCLSPIQGYEPCYSRDRTREEDVHIPTDGPTAERSRSNGVRLKITTKLISLNPMRLFRRSGDKSASTTNDYPCPSCDFRAKSMKSISKHITSYHACK